MRQLKLDAFFKKPSKVESAKGKVEETPVAKDVREESKEGPPSTFTESLKTPSITVVDELEFISEFKFEIKEPRNTGPCYLLSVIYDGKSRRALVKLYDPETEDIYFWYDNTGHKPYFLVDLPPDKVRQMSKVVNHPAFDHIELVEKYDLLEDRKRVMTKIVVKDPRTVAVMRGYFPKAWEAKIKYHDNYIYDRGLIPGMLYRIDNGNLTPVEPDIPKEIIERVEKIFDEESREIAREWVPLFQTPPPNPKRVALDIEVYTETREQIPNPKEAEKPVISAAFAGSDGYKRVLVLLSKDLSQKDIGEPPETLQKDVWIEFFDDEKAMIREIFRVINKYPVLLTFNGDNFDLNYLYHRALKLGIPRKEIPIFFTEDKSTRILKGVHLDLYRFFENRAIQVYAFGDKYKEHTLDAIAAAFLGVRKIQLDVSIAELTLSELISYNFRDSYLTLALTTFDDNLVMKLMVLLMRISRLSIEDVCRLKVSSWIRNLFYWEHRRRGYLIPLPEDIVERKGTAVTSAIIKGKKYAGAIVIKPQAGVYFNVIVVDFASLYPSIIKRWNLSYETVNCLHEECKKNRIPETNHWVCTRRRGLTAIVTGLLRDFRVGLYKKLSKRKDLPKEEREWYDVVQRAMKVYINASYGVFGADIFPLYCPPAAESVTAIGRYTIKSTINKAQEMGLHIIYGDTDSLFINNPTAEQVRKLIEWVANELGLDIEVDKEYRYVAFSGRKKNYIGVLKDGTVDVKGLVGKKKNTPEFLKRAFKQVVEALKDVKDQNEFDKAIVKIKEIIKECYEKLRYKELTLDELAFKTTLSKNIEEYTKSVPPHVKAAKMLMSVGKHVSAGSIISYVKVGSKLGVKPVQLAKLEEVDTSKYIDYIKTTFEQVLDALNIDLEELMGTSRLEFFLKR